MEKKKKSSIYLKLGYVIFFIAVFMISVYLLFPYDKARAYLEVKLSEASGADITISSMDLSLIKGMMLNDISIKKDINGDMVELLKADKVTVGSFYTLILPVEKTLSVKASLYGGALRGRIIESGGDKKKTSIDFSIEDLDISKNPVIKRMYGTEISGKLTGTVSLGDIKNGLMGMEGEMFLTLSNGNVKGIKLDKFSGGMMSFANMKLPDISFKSAELFLEKTQRIINVKSAKLTGDDVKIRVSGNVNLNRNIKASAANLAVGLNLSEGYLKKDQTLSLFDENFKTMKDGAGFYNIKIEGAISNPRVKNI